MSQGTTELVTWCGPSIDPEQSAHRGVWSVSSLGTLWVPKDPVLLRTAKTLIRLGTHVSLWVLPCSGSNIIIIAKLLSLLSQTLHYNWATTRQNVSSGVSDQARHKPACTATEASWSLEISTIESRDIILYKQRTTKALIRLRECAGWSAPFLCAYDIRHIFWWLGSILCVLYSICRVVVIYKFDII